MENISNGFQTHCTWKAVDGKNILEAINWTDGNENPDIEETIEAENCILLESPSEPIDGVATECRLTLICQAPYQIKQISVLSEARLLEVYGHHSEYIKTVRNEMVDEVDDMIVFRGEVQLERPTMECSLKFTGLKTKLSMWLYGVTIKLITAVASPFQSNLSANNERNQNNAQFLNMMASMLGPQTSRNPPQPIPPLSTTTQMWGNIENNSTPSRDALAAQLLQRLMPQAPPPPPQQDMMGMIMSLMQQPPTAPIMTQPPTCNITNPMSQPQLAALLNQLANPQQPQHFITPPLPQQQPQSKISQPEPVAQVQEIKVETEVASVQQLQPIKEDKSVQNVVEEKTEAIVGSSLEKTVLRELPIELSPESVDQVTEAVINNVECSLETMEQRLWNKILHRLQDMETRILSRMDEVVEALREAEEEEEEEEDNLPDALEEESVEDSVLEI